MLKAFARPERLTVDEWIERNVRLSAGRFRYAARPFMREPARAMGDLNRVCRVVIECCAQVGKTENMLGFLGWVCQTCPANFLWIMDSAKSCNKVVRNRMRPFLRDTVGVESLKRGSYVPDKSSSAVNISLGTRKNLMIGSARSASDLCSFPAKYIVCDEVSRFPLELENEGDPISLLLKRQLTFSRSMMVLASTPTSDQGAIHVNYGIGTQEVWCARCHCGAYLDIKYEDVDWTEDDHPTYTCKTCGEVYSEDGVRALEHCFAPPANANPVMDASGRIVRSFHIGAFMIPEVYSWSQIRREGMEAMAKGYATWQSFVNTTLGEPYVPSFEEQLNLDALVAGRKYFTRETLPSWITTICIGADTQDNRIEYIVCGFDDRGVHCAFIERGVILGDLSTPEPWQRWKALLGSMMYSTKDGRTLYPLIACQDAGGHHYYDVLTLSLELPRLRPVKGLVTAQGNDAAIVKSQKIVKASDIGRGNGQAILTTVNTVVAKDIIRRNMLLIQRDAKTAPWVVSSDIEARFDPVFFAQLNSEMRVVNASGKVSWKLKGSDRNEMLDCLVYCLTAHEIVRASLGDTADRECDIELPPEEAPKVTKVSRAKRRI